MASSFRSSLPNSLVPRLIFLAMLLILAVFWGSGLLTTVLISSILLLWASSTLFFNFPKHNKPVLVEEPVGEMVYTSTPGNRLPHMSDFAAEKEISDEDGAFSVDESLARSSISADSLLGSECLNPSCSSEDDCEVEWPIFRKDCWSDGSISDEESLIEIALPTGHYVGGHMKREVHKYKKMTHSPHSVSEGHGPMDYILSDEISGIHNCDEENLIEIDISIGSIKCSRIQI